MTEPQRKDLLAAVQACARALGADVAGDKPAPETYARGLAFIMGRLLGKPDFVGLVGRWALEYLPAPEPTAAPAGKGEA